MRTSRGARRWKRRALPARAIAEVARASCAHVHVRVRAARRTHHALATRIPPPPLRAVKHLKEPYVPALTPRFVKEHPALTAGAAPRAAAAV